MEKEEIYRRLKEAIDELLKRDRLLFKFDVNERSITHKLALYLEKQFDSWDVDCEYNRVGQDEDVKKVINFEKIEECYRRRQSKSNEVRVYPDIIVHKRGEDRNLVVIEAKKFGDEAGKYCDLLKLKEYKNQLGYEFCFFIEFETKTNNPRYRVFDEQDSEVALGR